MYCDGKLGWISTPRGTRPLMGLSLKLMRDEVFHVYVSLLLAGGAASVVASSHRGAGPCVTCTKSSGRIHLAKAARTSSGVRAT